MSIKPPDELSLEIDPALLLVSDADNLAQMPLGVQPAQGMLEDVELAGLVGDNHRVGEQAAPDDRADHGRLRGQPALTRVQAVQMSLPRGPSVPMMMRHRPPRSLDLRA